MAMTQMDLMAAVRKFLEHARVAQIDGKSASNRDPRIPGPLGHQDSLKFPRIVALLWVPNRGGYARTILQPFKSRYN